MTVVTRWRLFGALLLLAAAAPASAQTYETRWLSLGSFHNWYSNFGSEREEGLVARQQYGWRWPGVYRNTDMQAAKGLWIGAQNVRDAASGSTFPVRVVHSGPRVRGDGEIFPTFFEVVTRRDLTVVTVDGATAPPEAEMIVDRVDPELPADAMIVSRFNTLLGISVERRILQFSQEFHDNYHVHELTLVNTGNADGDAEIELPGQTLEGVMVYTQYRLAPTAETRYTINNQTGWGINTMNDARGDGVEVDPPDEQFRAQFAWHGLYPTFTAYNNVGGPILPRSGNIPNLNVLAADTLGRLGAAVFPGVVTLHADTAPGNPADDPRQPTTTNWIHSDDPYLSNNDAFNTTQMTTEYAVMTRGNQSPRHARAVEPSGLPGFLAPTGNPSRGTSGGYSFGNGYGPYTLAPGDTIRIVYAEAVAGLSRETAVAVGRAFKAANANSDALLTARVGGRDVSLTKNQWVFTARDSLFQTFRRAIANYDADYAIPQAPAPPSAFAIRSGGDRITLEWTPAAGAPPPAAWEIYRARARADSAYTLIHTAGPAETSFDDTTPVRGIDYFYYIQAVQPAAANPGGGGTPAGRTLRSSRYATQAFTAAQLQRPQGRTLDEVRVVPNPYYIGSAGDLRFPAPQTDRLAFFNIPGQCRIEIYTELGELVDTIEHTNGSGDTYWNQTTLARQTIVSGIYIAVITVTQDIPDPATGALLFRAGDRTFRKFAILR